MKHLATKPQAAALATTLILPALLVACGGGSDSTTPAPVTPTSLVINGTAATGAAMASAVVKLTCAKGTATVTASAAGVFSATITDGALPCVLTATSADGKTELHSLAAGTGNAATTANVTPLSELLIARLSGGDAKAFVSGFGASTAISATDVTAAQTALLASLKAAGLDTGSVTDIVGGALTAGSSAGYDGVLDKLGVLLNSAGITLTDLSTAVSTTTKTGSDTSNATIGTLLAPAASDCPGFKSGALRVIDLTGGESTVMTVDATKLTVNDGTTTYPLTRNAACDYTVGNANAARVLVSRAGVAVFMSGSGKTGWVGVAFPEQKLDVSALAGTYDAVTYDAVAGGGFGDTVFAADGKNGLSHNCTTLTDCTADTNDKGQLVPNAKGGFDYTNDPRNDHARVYAYRNASGKLLLVGQDDDGSLTLLVSKDKLALPAVNRVANYWQFTVNSAGLGAVVSDANTITAADSATGLVTRSFASDGHTDKVTYNAPYDGFRARVVNNCASASGGAYACNAVAQLPYGGLVVSVSADPAKNFVSVSVDKP